MSTVTLRKLGKRFGDITAVDAIDLTVDDGELFFLLGPSGCGKTTLLRMIAGFVEPTSGSIHFGDRDVSRVPPNRRGTGMVFQNYALWPHLTVFENVAYGLRVMGLDKAERTKRVERALGSAEIAALAKRRPNELSGGQQQRVALARALVIEPAVLLLDEPLSNLDASLRVAMRAEIKDVCKAAGITTIYVTHDQDEALSMADRIAVLREGRLEQVGTPRAVYDRPRSRFVAGFIGETNFLAATVRGSKNGTTVLDTPAGVLFSTAMSPDAATTPGASVTCSLRPEALRVARGDETVNRLEATRAESAYYGGSTRHHLVLTGGLPVMTLELKPGPDVEMSGPVVLAIDPADVVVIVE